MMYLTDAGTFLLDIVFGFAVGVFLVRMLLIAVGASFYDPICRFVYTLTNPVITPLRPIVPRWRRIEIASLVVAYLLCLLERGVYLLLFSGSTSVGQFLVGAVIDVFARLIWIVLIAMFVRAVLSWVVSVHEHSTLQLLVRITDPVIRPFRRLVRPVAGVDFSLMFASIALVLVLKLIVAPLYALTAML